MVRIGPVTAPPPVLPVAKGGWRTQRQGNGTREFERGEERGQLLSTFQLSSALFELCY